MAASSKLSRTKLELNPVHTDKCCVCGSEDLIDPKTCHGCHQRDYCGRACQKSDWGLHRHWCLRKKDACEMCGKNEGLNACSGCLRRQYCSEECQKKAWPEHKSICKAYKAVGLEVKDCEQVAIKLLEYTEQLCNSNLLESKLRVAMEALAFCKASDLKSKFSFKALYDISCTLSQMSRYEEAEIFAREMVAESDKLAPIQASHLIAAEQLSDVLLHQGKIEEALSVAHDASERFCPIVQDLDAIVRLMGAESSALRSLKRYQEALDIQEHCFEMLDAIQFPERVSASSLHFYATLLVCVGGRLDEAEATLKKALAKLERDGIEFHPGMVHVKSALGDVYREQGRKKEAKAMLKAVKKLVPKVFPKDHPCYKMFMERAE
jgi:tetratricopeptide (TPR) repeat protein